MNEPEAKQVKWDICGHENIVHFLQSAILNDNLAHAYLFAGPHKLGKQTVAYKFIASVLCQAKTNARPCGICASCLQLKNNVHPDFYLTQPTINPKTEKLSRGILIDQIKSLKYKLQQSSMLHGYKVALITNAHLMNLNTANALLKVLEEPTKKTIIILLVDDVLDLPQTIASRCQILKFLPVATNSLKIYLENQGMFNSSWLARQAHGHPGVALDLAHHKDLAKILKNNITDFFKIMESDFSDRLELVNKIVDWDKDEAINISKLTGLLHNWQLILRDIVLIKTDNEPLITNIDYLAELKKQAQVLDFLKLKIILTKMNQTSDYVWHNINSKSVLENLIINL